MINTVIVNPQKQDGEKIASLLSARGDFNVLAQGKDGYDALKLIGRLKPDIAILDNQLEFIEGGEIPPLLKVRSPGTAIVILAAKMSDHQLFRAASNEVAGFVYKEKDMDTLPEILKCVSGGGCFISPYLAARVLHILSSFNRDTALNQRAIAAGPGGSRCGIIKFPFKEDPAGYLTKMELQILTHIGEGNTSDEIASNLGLAVGTVRNYISSVMRKTGVRNRSQMARYAFFYGLVPLDPPV